MTRVVIDANILIDLVQLKMLPHFFALDVECWTTDLVLFELHDHQQAELSSYIDQRSLHVMEIAPEQLLKIKAIALSKPSLSEQDCSAFYQAQQGNGVLLTSDNKLRKFAQTNDVAVHGHLWIFDWMVKAQTMTGNRAIQKLDELCHSVNPKLNLPEEECIKRKSQWQN